MAARPDKPRIFLSYARSDGQEFARLLYERLSDEGLSIWFDRREMQGGKEWWKQIVEALETVEYLLLVMTPNAIESDIVSREWRLARQKGVGIVPVVGAPTLNLSNIPRWMEKTHFVDSGQPEEWHTLLNTLRSPSSNLRTPFMAEDLPTDYVERTSVKEELLDLFLRPNRHDPQATTAALWGPGGCGKTTLAIALCHDDRVQEGYSDGILWVTVGKDPGDLTKCIEDLIYTISGQRPGFSTPRSAAAYFCELIRDLELLIVIDDAWSDSAIKPFLQGGPRCSRLITTRDRSSLPIDCPIVRVDLMNSDEAFNLLKAGLPREGEEDLKELGQRLGQWPILLKLVNGALRERVSSCGQSLLTAITVVSKALATRGLRLFDEGNAEGRGRVISSTLNLSLSLFSQFERERFFELTIFPDHKCIPLEKVLKLWEITGRMDEISAENLCLRLFRCSLAQYVDLAKGHIVLHDVVHAFLCQQTESSLSSLHRVFLDGHHVCQWDKLDTSETYLWHHLPYHLMQADLGHVLIDLYFSYGWIKTSLAVTGVLNTINTFRYLRSENTVALVQNALQLSAHVLQANPAELPGQLLGRLQGVDNQRVQGLLDGARREFGHAWLYPLNHCLSSPGGPHERTLAGHRLGIYTVAITPQGTHIVSGSEDCTIKIWDMASGLHLRTLKGHEGWVFCLAVSPDGQRIFSGSRDGTIRIWNLGSGDLEVTLRGHSHEVWSIAVAPDGQHIISGSVDGTARVWDLSTRTSLQAGTEGGLIKALAFTKCGKYFLSGSTDGVLRLWNTTDATLVNKWQAHQGWILSLAITPDGHNVVTTSSNSIKFWNILSQTLLSSFTNLSGWPLCAAVSPSGSHALVGFNNGTLGLLDLSTRSIVVTGLLAHEGMTEGVSFSPDGNYAVSAGMDKLLKVWNVNSLARNKGLNNKPSPVTAVAIADKINRTVSSYQDGTLREWDLDTGESRSLNEGGGAFAKILAISPDGDSLAAYLSDGRLVSWRRSIIGSLDKETTINVTRNSAGTSDLKNRENITALQESFTRWLSAYQMIGQWNSPRSDRGEVVTTLQFSNDGTQLVASLTNGAIRSWQIVTDNAKPLQRSIVLADGSVRAWTEDTSLGTLLKGREEGIYLASVSHNAKHAVFCGARYIKIRDLVSGEELVVSMCHETAVRAVSVSSIGERILIASHDGGIQFWDRKSNQWCSRSLSDCAVDTIILSRDDQLGILVCTDRKLRVWNLATDTFLASHSSDHILTACAINLENSLIAVGDTQGQLHLLRIQGA